VNKNGEVAKRMDASSIGTVVPPWERSKANHPLIKERVKAAAHGIFNQITSGQYSYGTRLASERDLALEFSLSRAAVRQVIEFLETYEIVKRRPNSGTFVAYTPQPNPQTRAAVADGSTNLLDVGAIAETASPFEMNILCSIIEPEMVRLAALYMSVRDLAELRSILDEIEKIVVDAEQFAHLEKKFLMKIAEGTHNRLLVTVYGIITEVRRQPHWCATRVQLLSPERISESQNRLKSLYTALENHDAESAAEFMKLVIAGAQDDLLNNRL
jgi:DNA-binding FadR family transcriptional regulator